MSPKRKLTPQEEARLAQVKESFQKRKEITSGVASIKNKIGVYSGKGGVGKSTVACNIAITLANQGHKVGLLDADIYGPSVPTLLGIGDKEPEAYREVKVNILIQRKRRQE